jgi:hypothetical protein
MLVWSQVGAWTPASVQTFRRIARRHGIALRQPIGEQLLERAPFSRQIQEGTDVQRLLAIAGRPEPATTWLVRTAGFSLLATVLLLVVDLASWLVEGRLSFPPGLCFLFGMLWAALAYMRLRNAALRRQRGLDVAVSEAFTELAILTYTRQVPVETALEDVIAQCQTSGWLRGLFQDQRWRDLVRFDGVGLPEFERRMVTSHTAIYEAIAANYGVPAFSVLARSMRRINDKGQSPAEVLTGLARTAAEGQLAEMLVRSEQARARQSLPVGLMVVPLLVLIGFPLLVGLARTFS